MTSKYPGVAKVVSRLIWEDTPGQSHNFISGCCAVGSAPALGAGGPGFESPHSDHLTQKNRLKRRFFCVFCSIFVSWTIAVQRRFQGQKSGRHMIEDGRWNRQIPNPSLTGVTAVFFYCRYDKFLSFPDISTIIVLRWAFGHQGSRMEFHTVYFSSPEYTMF